MNGDDDTCRGRRPNGGRRRHGHRRSSAVVTGHSHHRAKPPESLWKEVRLLLDKLTTPETTLASSPLNGRPRLDREQHPPA